MCWACSLKLNCRWKKQIQLVDFHGFNNKEIETLIRFKINKMRLLCVFSLAFFCSQNVTSVSGNYLLLYFSQVEFRSCLDSLIITMAYQAPTMCQVLFRCYQIYPSNSLQGSVMLSSFYVQGNWSLVSLNKLPRELSVRTDWNVNSGPFISKVWSLLSLREYI